MKATEITCSAILSLLFGIAAPAPCLRSQQSDGQGQFQNEQSRQKSQEDRRQPADPARQTPSTNQPQQVGQRRQDPNASQQRRGDNRGTDPQRAPESQSRHQQDPRQTWRNNDNRAERDRHHRAEHDRYDRVPREMPHHLQHGAWQERRARNWQFEHRTWQERGGYRGYRIPGDRFGHYFGPRHGFRIYGLPFLVVDGYPRFQYGGYWIRFIDPWPEYWPDDWYETDDVYIAYTGDGYYLFNRQYPSAGVAVEVLM
jgi:hypothetical protein